MFVAHEAALGQRNRCTVGGADADYPQCTAQFAAGRGSRGVVCVFNATGQQQHLCTAVAARGAHVGGQLQGLIKLLTTHRHDVRVQCIEQVAQGVVVAGERGNQVCAAGVGNQRYAAVRVVAQQVANLALGLLKARRWQVIGEHAARHLQHNDQAAAVLAPLGVI